MKSAVSSDRKSKIPHGTQEWASKNVNIQTGCENDCRYCYAKNMALRFRRAQADTWKNPSINNSRVVKAYRKADGTIMFPTTHDITPANVEQCVTVLNAMLDAGNKVLIVSKPSLDCIKTICKKLAAHKDQILFRFTIGSTDDKVLSFWEPGAPKFKDRFAALEWAYKQGFQTSVSCEPMLDVHIGKVVEAVQPFVTDSIWIGRVNRLNAAIALNCPKDTEAKARAQELTGLMSDEFIQGLYAQYKENPIIKWKDSIKKIVGIPRPTKVGLDI